MNTPCSRSVIDLIRAQMKGAAGRAGKIASSYDNIARHSVFNGWVEASIFVPHGGGELDNLSTASTYKAKA